MLFYSERTYEIYMICIWNIVIETSFFNYFLIYANSQFSELHIPMPYWRESRCNRPTLDSRYLLETPAAHAPAIISRDWTRATQKKADNSSQRPVIWRVNRWRRDNDCCCCAGASAKQVAPWNFFQILRFPRGPLSRGSSTLRPRPSSVSRFSLSARELHAHVLPSARTRRSFQFRGVIN